MAPNPIVGLLFYLAVGLWLIKVARNAYSHPDSFLQRWYSYLPQKGWTRRMLRAFSVFWIFGAILIILSGLVRPIPFLNNHRGDSLVLAFVSIAIVGTLLLVPREKSNPLRSTPKS
jgi:hypothetical protein